MSVLSCSLMLSLVPLLAGATTIAKSTVINKNTKIKPTTVAISMTAKDFEFVPSETLLKLHLRVKITSTALLFPPLMSMFQ